MREKGRVADIMDAVASPFGFIAPYEDKGQDQDGQPIQLYFHCSALAEGEEFSSLKRGDEVTFEPIQTTKGLRAVKVGKVSG